MLKRTIEDIFINNCHPKILKIWEANMDIQPVGSMFGVAYYIAKYCSKEESHEIRKCTKEAINMVQKSSKKDLNSNIHKACRNIMSHRERSAQEAAYVLCGLKLKCCSRSCVLNTNTKPRNERTRMLKVECIDEEEIEDEHLCSDIFDK